MPARLKSVRHRIIRILSSASNYYAGLPVTIAAGQYAALVMCSDQTGTLTPNNGIVVVVDRDTEKCSLTKRVAGTPTELFDEDITYSAGATLIVVKDKTLVTVFYNNVKVGTDQTISDPSIINNIINYEFGDSTGTATILALSFDAEVLTNSDFNDGATGWATVGTPDAENYLVYVNNTLRIVSEDAVMGVAQTIDNTTLYKCVVDIASVVAGRLQVNGTSVLMADITADTTSYIISDGTTLSLRRVA